MLYNIFMENDEVVYEIIMAMNKILFITYAHLISDSENPQI